MYIVPKYWNKVTEKYGGSFLKRFINEFRCLFQIRDMLSETCRSLIHIMNCILLGALVGYCINCKNMHCVGNIESCPSLSNVYRSETNVEQAVRVQFMSCVHVKNTQMPQHTHPQGTCVKYVPLAARQL